MMEKATELEFLRWCFAGGERAATIYAYFSPADGDVRDHMYRLFTKSTGKALPEGYRDWPIILH